MVKGHTIKQELLKFVGNRLNMNSLMVTTVYSFNLGKAIE